MPFGEGQFELLDRERVDGCRQRPEHQFAGGAIDVHEDGSPPTRHGHRNQRMVVEVEVVGLPLPRCTSERAIEAVQPRVVRTSDQRAVGRVSVVAQGRGPMAAHVQERAQRTFAVSHHQDRHPAHPYPSPGSRLGKIVDHPGAHPSLSEHTVHLDGVMPGVAVPLCGQRARRANALWIGDLANHRTILPHHPRLAEQASNGFGEPG